jgi:hypothetical protein
MEEVFDAAEGGRIELADGVRRTSFSISSIEAVDQVAGAVREFYRGEDITINELFQQAEDLVSNLTLDPLEAEGAWRDIILPAQQEDGTVEQVSAGDMADAIDRRQKAAERLLDCVKN